jgi:DNA primase
MVVVVNHGDWAKVPRTGDAAELAKVLGQTIPASVTTTMRKKTRR